MFIETHIALDLPAGILFHVVNVNRDFFESTTSLRELLGSENRSQRLALFVVVEGVLSTHPLPERGDVLIGRSNACDVQVEDPSISRRHAVLHLGGTLTIEDLGSANGTCVRDARLPDVALSDADNTAEILDARLRPNQRVAVAPGDVITLGSTVVMVQPAEMSSVRPMALSSNNDDFIETEIVVDDPSMVRLHELVARLAKSNISVLLLGETGVGKEVIAERLHAHSNRSTRPMLRINCATLSETLLESELFGHERGSFTGAITSKAGLLETAHGGTVFLDEVAELPLATQAKLLRVLEEGRALRVGGLTPRPVDVRIVSATNRDLAESVRVGTFRRDLYFRLNGIALLVPPLRERTLEIESLAMTFVRQASELADCPPPELSLTALGVLRAHSWPGNIRELRNVVERAVLLCGDGLILPEHLHLELAAPDPSSRSSHSSASDTLRLTTYGSDYTDGASEEQERQRILQALERCAGNQTYAAKLLGISRRTLVTRLGKLGIPRPRKGTPLAD